jgi:hypothetical protein
LILREMPMTRWTFRMGYFPTTLVYGFETLDESYARVSKIAKDVGKGEVFKYLNKLLSKFAHPTALSIIYNGGETENRLRQKFYDVGMRLSEEILKLLTRQGDPCS